MLTVSVHIRCVSLCQPVFIRVGISIQIRVDLGLDETEPAALKTKTYSLFNEKYENVKLQAFFATGRQTTIDSFSVDGFSSRCNSVFEAMGCFYHFCHSQEVRRSLTGEDIQRGRRESSLHWDDTIYRRKASMLLKCENANGGDCTKQPILLNDISENTFRTGVPFSWATIRRDKVRKIIWLRAVRYWITKNLRPKIDNFPLIFKNTWVSMMNIGKLIKNYA